MKLWGGRFTGRRDPRFEEFSESFSLDQRFILYDLRVNLAYVQELGRVGVLKPSEVRRLGRALEAIRRHVERHPDWAGGNRARTCTPGSRRNWGGESALWRANSAPAAAATTWWPRKLACTSRTPSPILNGLWPRMLEALLGQARRHPRVVMPGYTHLQPAQPILFSHYLLAYFEMFTRDASRLEDCRKRADELPMGAGALAGTAYPFDRERLARALGFARAGLQQPGRHLGPGFRRSSWPLPAH